ncbi:MAG: hypothetical protein ACRYGR_09995 [Janthinobacterium lividum]
MSKRPIPAMASDLVLAKPSAVQAAPSPATATPTAPAQYGNPLNFRVPPEFRRRYKMQAASDGLKLNELLMLSFEAYLASRP